MNIKNLLIFLNGLNRMRPVFSFTCAIAFGISSNLTSAPLPSMDLGERRKVAPSNIMSGILSSMSWVIRKCTPFPDNASVTSSIGEAAKKNANVTIYKPQAINSRYNHQTHPNKNSHNVIIHILMLTNCTIKKQIVSVYTSLC